MSDSSSTAHGDGHHHAPDHVPHVTPLPVYLKTFGALVVLTIVTVAVSRVHLGTAVNLAVALIIATIKASVVAAMFMHLAVDHKFHSVIFVSSVVFLGIFVAFTMFDTEARGKADAIERTRPHNSRDPFAKPTGMTTVAVPQVPAAAPAAPAPSASASAATEPVPAPSASASAEPESSASAPPATSASAPVAPSASAAPPTPPAP